MRLSIIRPFPGLLAPEIEMMLYSFGHLFVTVSASGARWQWVWWFLALFRSVNIS